MPHPTLYYVMYVSRLTGDVLFDRSTHDHEVARNQVRKIVEIYGHPKSFVLGVNESGAADVVYQQKSWGKRSKRYWASDFDSLTSPKGALK